MSAHTPGTRVMVATHYLTGTRYDQAATVLRWHRISGPRNALPAGYHRIRFDSDGGVMLVHSEQFRATA